MSDGTKIEWADATWNPVTGCTLVSEGCRNCYAARLAATRMKHHPSREGLARINADGVAKFTGEVRFNEEWLTVPLHWRKPRRVFVCAHGDLFHPDVPGEWIDRVFAVMALCPQHTFLVLTKRPERMRVYLSENDMPARVADPGARLVKDGDEAHDYLRWHQTWPLPNVWLGVSIEDQATADERIPYLLATPAARRFVSAEPLLGPVTLSTIDVSGDEEIAPLGWDWLERFEDAATDKTPRLDWVIVGGESGPGARPMHPDWARRLRDQCQAAGVAFFFKQWGEWAPCAEYPTGGNTPLRYPHADGCFGDHPENGANPYMDRVGKKAAGAMLDGRAWRQIPGEADEEVPA